MTNKEAFVEFSQTIFTHYFNVFIAQSALKRLGTTYGMDMDAVETALRAAKNIEEVAQGLLAQPDEDQVVRVVGEMGFHMSQLASCVYDDSTGLDIVEPIGDAFSLLIVLETMEKLRDSKRD
jgi:hypothetical protein